MEVIYPRCAGLDVHKQTVVACVRIAGDGAPLQQVRTFDTTTSGLLALADWLDSFGVEHVAMEATGVYWKPVWAVLADEFDLILANAAQVRNVPGRKTDVNDAMWLADLLAHGLIRASFVPPLAVQALRDLTRTRKQLVREKAAVTSRRIDKTWQAANIKLGSVLSDIMGESGRAILDALAAGESDPEALVGQVRYPGPAPRGPNSSRPCADESASPPAACCCCASISPQADALDAATARPSTRRWATAWNPFARPSRSCSTVPGVGEVCSRGGSWPRSASTWRASPPLPISSPGPACARKTMRAPASDDPPGFAKGAPWLKTLLVQAAWAATRRKASYLRALFHRIPAKRRGAKKAIIAVAASMLTAIWHMLRDGTEWHDLGAAHFDRADAHKTANSPDPQACSKSAIPCPCRSHQLERERFISAPRPLLHVGKK